MRKQFPEHVKQMAQQCLQDHETPRCALHDALLEMNLPKTAESVLLHHRGRATMQHLSGAVFWLLQSDEELADSHWQELWRWHNEA